MNSSDHQRYVNFKRDLEIDELRRLLWQFEIDNRDLHRELNRKEKTIEDLSSKLDKFQSVLFLRPGHSSNEEQNRAYEEESKESTARVEISSSLRRKRVAISAEPQRQSQKLMGIAKRHPKNERSRELIKNGLLDNDFLRNLELTQICEIVECMYLVDVAKNCLIIREGDDGSLVYIMEEGTVEVSKDGRYMCTLSPGKVFGELAILYNCTRTASVRAMTACRIWAINRRTFQSIMMKTGMAKHSEYVAFLQIIPIFRDLTDDEIHKLADLLNEETFKCGEYITRQGSQCNTFFIVSKGQVKMTHNASSASTPKMNEKLHKILIVGGYFGDQALLCNGVLDANYLAAGQDGCTTCLTIDRNAYIELLERRNDGKSPVSPVSVTRRSDLAALQLTDLKFVTTLGTGGFGRIELVHLKNHEGGQFQLSSSFALKVMKKSHIVETNQQEHIMNERKVLFTCESSDFIVKLYRTFRDAKQLYMLMEVCLGGEVWSLLRDRVKFDEEIARFYTCCAMEAIGYLHRRGFIYRDLKPENMLLDNAGFAKLVDFGFAKDIGFSHKTWTFCGTPEYLPPEIILNKGHDFAVDFWSLGIFIFELLTGLPPFVAPDPMRTYNLILKGIDALDFPRCLSKNAVIIIKKLCREAPNERLGCRRGGFKDLARNRWFDGVDFEGLRNRTIQPPIIPIVRHNTDYSNFDQFPPDDEPQPPDDLTGWDDEFDD